MWLEIVLLAHDLIVWTQALLLDGSSPRRMSISATSGSSASISSRPSSAVPARSPTTSTLAAEQQLEPLAKGLVILDEHKAQRHVAEDRAAARKSPDLFPGR